MFGRHTGCSARVIGDRQDGGQASVIVPSTVPIVPMTVIVSPIVIAVIVPSIVIGVVVPVPIVDRLHHRALHHGNHGGGFAVSGAALLAEVAPNTKTAAAKAVDNVTGARLACSIQFIAVRPLRRSGNDS